MLGDAREYYGCHRDVEVRKCILTNASDAPVEQRGLFAATGYEMEQYTFIGVYWGRKVRSGSDRCSSNNPYAMQRDGFRIIPDRRRLGKGHHPIASINEPPDGVTANCAFVQYCSEADIFADGRKSTRVDLVSIHSSWIPPSLSPSPPWSQVAVHAARRLKRGEQLYAL